jgi:hypothetical protein
VSRPRETERRHIDDGHDVVTVHSGGEEERWRYRRRPCGGCPWRIDQTGEFPGGAFEASARTAHDMSTHMFGCHESGTDRPSTCAGFLLRGADHNIGVRLKLATGAYDPGLVSDGGHELHDGYLSMALANGAEPEELLGCRYSYAEEQRIADGNA